MRLKRLVLAAVLLGCLGGVAMAQSSLGIGNAEPVATPSGGMLGPFFTWVGAEQKQFYKEMTDALRAMKNDGSAAWLLVGLSFLYGILHAAGPGHGKVVISSYMVANETQLRRGVMLSFASALMQAVTAIVVVGAGFLILRGTTVSMTDAANWLEIASYALIVAFGLWLLFRKTIGARTATHEHHEHTHDHGHGHHHDHGETCETCGHAHMPGPQLTDTVKDWRSALGAIVAVGLRPCSGAVIVLSFALLNGLWLGGILSVVAMALGTAITVSALATLAVTAKNTALSISGQGAMSARVHSTIEIGGALLLVALGLVLLGGSLAG